MRFKIIERESTRLEQYKFLLSKLRECHIREEINTEQYRSIKGEFLSCLKNSCIDFSEWNYGAPFRFLEYRYNYMNKTLGITRKENLSKLYKDYSESVKPYVIYTKSMRIVLASDKIARVILNKD